MLARVEQSHTEISLSCHITTSRTFMIVLPFNMAIIVHDSFVSISSKLCQTHTLLKKKKCFWTFKKKKRKKKKTSIFYSKYSSSLPVWHLQLLPICLWKMPSPFLLLLLILQKIQIHTYILNTKEKITFWSETRQNTEIMFHLLGRTCVATKFTCTEN